MRYWGLVAFLQKRGGRLLVHRTFDPAQLEPWTHGLADYFWNDKTEALRSIRRLVRFRHVYAKLMEAYDVLISPTVAEPPPPIGHLATDLPFETAFERLQRYAPFTPIQNAAGAPAISLPLGRSAEGIPIGVQFAAAYGNDRLLLELASALESARPWERVAPAARWT
jgi:amidase